MVDASLPAGDRERWAHPNRLGSTIVISDGTGAVLETHTMVRLVSRVRGGGGLAVRSADERNR